MEDKVLTVDELYNYLISQMTPEQALRKLIETQVEQYNLLRTKEGEGGSPFIIIAMAAMELNWSIGVENKDDDTEIRGLAVGTAEYLDELFSEPKNDEYKDSNIQTKIPGWKTTFQTNDYLAVELDRNYYDHLPTHEECELLCGRDLTDHEVEMLHTGQSLTFFGTTYKVSEVKFIG